MGKYLKQLKNKNQKILTESLKIPKDLVCEDSVISLNGNNCVWIENYIGILEYTSNLIIIKLKHGQICFQGANLNIVFYTSQDMKIIGYISNINFEA